MLNCRILILLTFSVYFVFSNCSEQVISFNISSLDDHWTKIHEHLLKVMNNDVNLSEFTKYMEKLKKNPNFDINTKDISGKTLLYYACQKNVNLIPLLLNFGASLNIKYFGDNNLFHLLCKNNSEETLKLFFKYYPQPLTDILNAKNISGHIPFHLACLHAFSIETFSKLSDSVKLINFKDGLGNTPLHIACKFCNLNCIEFLLNSKVKLNKKDQNGHTALLFTYKRLLKGLYKQEQFNTIIDIIKLIIADSAADNLNLGDQHENTILHLTCKDSMHEIITALLNVKNIDKTRTNKDLDTPLHFASRRCTKDIIELLIDLPNDIYARNREGNMPIHEAAKFGNKAILEYYLEKDISLIDMENNEGNTLFHLSCQSNQVATASSIIYFKIKNLSKTKIQKLTDGLYITDYEHAYKNKKNNDGDAPLHMASQYNALDAVKYLFELKNLQKGAVNKQLNTSLHSSCLNGCDLIADYLLAQGMAIDEINVEGNTPLHLACINGNLDTVKVLINYQGKPKIVYKINPVNNPLYRRVNKEGDTPLHLAFKNGKKEIVNYLLEIGADFEALNYKKLAPYELGFLNLSENDKLINFILKKKPEFLDIRNNIDILIEQVSQDLELVKLILKKHPDLFILQKNEALISTAIKVPELKSLILEKKPEFANIQSIEIFITKVSGIPELIELLLEKRPEMFKLQSNTTLVEYACQDRELLDLIILKRPELRNNSQILIEEACKIPDNLDTLKLLLESFNKIYVKNEGHSLLHLACQVGSLAAIKYLINLKFDIESKNKREETALHIACRKGYISIAKFLIENKANIEAIDKKKYRPIHLACIGNKLAIVELLIIKGANVNAENNEISPIQIAHTNQNNDIVDLLNQKGAV